MTWITSNPNAMPGVGQELVAQIRELLLVAPEGRDMFPLGVAISGASTRDPDNPSGRVDILRAGMPMGRLTSSGKYAPSVIGVLGKALLGTDTQLNLLTTAEATELVRRVGGSGSFKLTGPATANGTARTLTVAFSAVGTGSGANEVQLVAWTSVPTAGTFTMTFLKSDGTYVTTAAIAYNAPCSTTVANAINAVLGTSAVSVAATTSTTADQGFSITFSGTNYAAVDQPLVVIDTTALTFTGTAGYTASETTKGIPVANTVAITPTKTSAVWTVTVSSIGTPANGAFYLVINGVNTTALAWNIAAADMQAAIRTATGDSATTVGLSVQAAGVSGALYTITFDSTLGDPTVGTRADSVGVATTFEPVPMILAKVTAGVDGRFVAGSWIQAIDGSEKVITLFANKYGVSVFNALLQQIDVQYADVLTEGRVRTAMIINYGSDTGLQAWLKAQLRQFGGHWIFDDDYIGTSN